MLNYIHYLAGKGKLRPPYVVNFILGGVATAQPRLIDLGLLVESLPPDSLWLAGGIGRHQLGANALSLAAGGGVRIGLEDNLYLDHGRTALATNFALVERVVAFAALLGRAPMPPAVFRERYLHA